MLLCLDFANLVIRHASNPFTEAVDDLGRPVGGAVGAISQSLRLVREYRPSHLLIAADGPRDDNHRREIDLNYKADRKPPDDDIRRQFALAYQAAKIIGLPIVREASYEADDIIASAVCNLPKSMSKSVIVSGDRDLLALINDQTKLLLLRPRQADLIDRMGCYDLMGVYPEQIQSYKALVGDRSDGIPGARGVGPKAACALLSHYKDISEILDCIDKGGTLEKVKPAVADKIIADRANVDMSYKLAGLVCNLSVNFDDLVFKNDIHDDECGEELESIGLRHLRPHLTGGAPIVKPREGPLDLDNIFAQL